MIVITLNSISGELNSDLITNIQTIRIKTMQYSHMNPRREQFKQNFEDSQANYSENQPQNARCSSGKPVQLIKIQRNGKISVGSQALQIICSYNEPIGFVSLAGKTRTGKSCLLNRMLNIKGQGFRVDSSTSSCTEGIWMWSDPFRNEKYHNLIFFIDTQGTDSLVKDPQNDAKIFTIAVLISSFFIYNSVGNIDERSIGELQMVTALSKKIQTGDSSSDSGQLIRFMPKFMWLLRDFMLELEDKHYRKISANTYLQNCLSGQNQIGSQESNRIKRGIVTYFPLRQCLTLVRPVYEEEMIYHLNQLQDHRLRRQFMDGVNSLRNKIIDNTGPKLYGGKEITGPGMSVMIQSYADAFNSGSVPNIRSAWEQIAADQGNQAYQNALEVYQNIFQNQLNNEEPHQQNDLTKIIKKLRIETMSKFKEEAGANLNQHRDHERKLEDFISNNEQQIIEDNQKLCYRHNNNLIAMHSQGIKAKLQSQQYRGQQGAAQLSNDIQICKSKYNQEAIGRSKGDILAQFATTLAPIIMLIQSDNSQRELEERQRRRIADEEFKKQQKILEEKNRSMQKQLDAQNRTQNAERKKQKRKKQAENKSKSSGCCGGSCAVM